MEKTASKVNKEKKPAKPYVKFIWLLISLVIAAAAFFVRSGNPELPFAVGAAFWAAMFISSIIAAQYQNEKRQQYAEVDEEGKRIQRGKYFLQSLIYYLFIIFCVVLLFFGFWVSNIISV
ncbi:MAG: hypothetical protein MJ168_07290 [Clostridia bacterium]|nr:hypothetical protein [Clostridia bacterium]